jgi:tRNA1Val (adenine37-N6)-methyltransferase
LSAPRQPSHQFKGWTIPGPAPTASPSGTASGETAPEETLDALCGHFKIFQLKEGHRFSTDDLLVAWYGTSNCVRAERILDLGSGLGTVAMIAGWRLPATQIVAIEAQTVSFELSLKSHAFNGLQNRIEARLGDFRDPALFREGECFDLILGSPPYFPLDAGVPSEHPQKLACRFETRGDVADYLRAAVPRMAPGGMVSLVFPVAPAHQLERVLMGAAQTGLVIVRSRWVRLKETDSPLLGVFLFMKQNDLPEAFVQAALKNPFREPDLIIRLRDGSISPEYSAIKLSIGFPP